MGTLQNYNRRWTTPWSLANELASLFGPVAEAGTDSEYTAWSPSVDVAEDKESFRIHAELPGLKKDDVKISVKDNILMLRGEKKFADEKKKDNYYRIERSYGMFARQFTLPRGVDTNKIAAKMEDGVLEVMIPKLPEAQEKEVAIEVH